MTWVRLACQLSMLALVSGVRIRPVNHSRPAHPPLCAPEIVAETCSQVSAMGQEVMPEDLQEILSMTRADVLGLWTAFAASPHVGMTCSMLCKAAVGFLERKVRLPPTSDVGCYAVQGEMFCDLDLSEHLVRNLVDADIHMPDLHDSDNMLSPSEPPPPELVAHNGSAQHAGIAEEASSSSGSHSALEMATRVANLFRIYPFVGGGLHVAQASLLETNGTNVPHDWEKKVAQTNLQALAYLEVAIRRFRMQATHIEITRWFGLGASEGLQMRSEVQRVMNAVAGMLRNVAYVYPGEACDSRTVAYVYPRAGRNVKERCAGPVAGPGEKCVKNGDGQFLFYLCERYMRNDVGYQIETLLHEGSHHAEGFTEDVCMRGFHGEEQPVFVQQPLALHGVGPKRVGDFVWIPYTGEDIESFTHVGKDVLATVWMVTESHVVLVLGSPSGSKSCGSRAYGQRSCLALARLEPFMALRNADNFCYYVSHVVTGASSAASCHRSGDFCVGDVVTYSHPELWSDASGKTVRPGDVGIVQYPHFPAGTQVRCRDLGVDGSPRPWRIGNVTDEAPLKVDGWFRDEVRAIEGEQEMLQVRFNGARLATAIPASAVSGVAGSRM